MWTRSCLFLEQLRAEQQPSQGRVPAKLIRRLGVGKVSIVGITETSDYGFCARPYLAVKLAFANELALIM